MDKDIAAREAILRSKEERKISRQNSMQAEAKRHNRLRNSKILFCILYKVYVVLRK
jgi:hypothetical protein